MKIKFFTKHALMLSTAIIMTAGFTITQTDAADRPSLMIMSQPIPESLKNSVMTPVPSAVSTTTTTRATPPRTTTYVAPVRTASVPAYIESPKPFESAVYSNPVKVREIQTHEVVGKTYYQPTETLVTKKVSQIDRDLAGLHSRVVSLATELETVEKRNDDRAAQYYAAIATINTQLQSGTTPGNPRLVKKLSTAEDSLETLAGSMDEYNKIAMDTSQAASEAQFLLEETRSAYGLFGAIEEDHIQLAKTEDTINNTLVMVERVLNTVNDDQRRTGAYVNSERDNLRTLALGVTKGDLYGRNLSNRPFSAAGPYDTANVSSDAPLNMTDMATAPVAAVQTEELVVSSSDFDTPAPIVSAPIRTTSAPTLNAPRILAKVKFDRSNVEFEQPVYVAVNDALERYPDARFDLVAVNPSQGNAAQVAIESTRARRNAEKVLRTLTQMGLDSGRVDLSYDDDANAESSEVHLYVK